MKRLFYLLSFFLLIISCKKTYNLTEENLFEYDQSLAIYENVKISRPQTKKYPALENHLNLKFLENKKTKIEKIKFKDYSLLPVFWDFSYLKNITTGYCYGTKSILGNNLFLYSEDFKNTNDRFKYNQYHQVGILLLEKNNSITSWVKIYETDIDSEKLLQSYLYNNYIISIETLNFNYDIANVKSSDAKKKYKYVIFKIKEKGDVVILDINESKKIISKWLKEKELNQLPR